MKLTRRTLLNQAAAPAVAALLPSLALAQAAKAKAPALNWPRQALKIVVPFPPGGTSDVIARMISQPLQQALGVSVVVENRAGANGVVGSAAVANSTDEYTMLLSDMTSLALNPLINKELPYKAADLKGATLLAYSPHLLVAHPSVAANNMKELVALSQAKGMNVASSGSGSANHLGVVDIALTSGLKWQHVPFRGGAAAIADTAAGNTQLCLNGMVATLPLVQAGRLKIIGVSKRTRMALISHVPTLAEQGVTGFESGTYQGIAIPANLPKAAAEKLSATLVEIIRSPDIRAKLAAAGAEVMTSTADETTKFLDNEGKRWQGVIQRAGKQIEGNV